MASIPPLYKGPKKYDEGTHSLSNPHLPYCFVPSFLCFVTLHSSLLCLGEQHPNTVARTAWRKHRYTTTVYGLLLVVKRAAVRMRKAAPREPVRSPAAIMCDHLEKEFALPGGARLPGQLAWFKKGCSIEESLVSQFCRKLAGGLKLPLIFILHCRLKHYLLQQIPNVQEFS